MEAQYTKLLKRKSNKPM